MAFLVTLIITLVNHLDIVYYMMWMMFFIAGLIFMVLGIIGEYLAKIYLEVKARQVYYVRSSNIEAINLDE